MKLITQSRELGFEPGNTNATLAQGKKKNRSKKKEDLRML